MSENNQKIIIFDTTMRDGELTPGVKMNLQQKIIISQLLEEMGVDITALPSVIRYTRLKYKYF